MRVGRERGSTIPDADVAPTARAGLATEAAVDLSGLTWRRRGSARRGPHRMRALCEELGSPELVLPTVHVVGTDGKTSVVRMVASLLGAMGLRVGETTSPHLQEVAERIRVAGRPLTAEMLAGVSARLATAMAEAERRTGEPVTFFEAVPATALAAFVDLEVDVAVVEAGIGGVGDATAVLQGRVSVVTPVSEDHPELGRTPAAVAREKGGVAVPGSVMVTSRQVPEVDATLRGLAAGRGVTVHAHGRDHRVLRRRALPDGQRVELEAPSGRRVTLTLPLLGAHQAVNASAALATVEALVGERRLDAAAVRAGFAAVELPGRVELLRRADTADVVIDGAHDVAAMRALVAALRDHGLAGRRPCTVVLGVGGGRDAAALAREVSGLATSLVVTRADAPGAEPTGSVAGRLRGSATEVVQIGGVRAALAEASRRSGPGGLVVVAGSLHLAGEARAVLRGA